MMAKTLQLMSYPPTNYMISYKFNTQLKPVQCLPFTFPKKPENVFIDQHVGCYGLKSVDKAHELTLEQSTIKIASFSILRYYFCVLIRYIPSVMLRKMSILTKGPTIQRC